MEEAAFLQAIKANPGNGELRAAYQAWLERQGDHERVECMRLMNERSQLEKEAFEISLRIRQIDRLVRSHLLGRDQEWLDTVYPLIIHAPHVGKFYTAPSPNAAPYVAVGDVVTPETIVGLIEAMKVFNEIPADIHGVITGILVANESGVEYGQPLFRLGRPPRPIAGG